MKFEDTTIQVSVSKEQLLYCFKADTVEEFDRRLIQLANDIQMKIEKELYKEVMERGIKK